MRRWFLSYNSQDLALMQALGGGAAAQGRRGAHFLRAQEPARRRLLAAGTRQGDRRGDRLRAAGRREWARPLADRGILRSARPPREGSQTSRSSWSCSTASPRPDCRSCGNCTGSSPPTRRPSRTLAQLLDAASGGGTRPGELVAAHRALSRPRRHDRGGQRLLLRPDARDRRGASRRSKRTPDRLPVLLGNSGVGKSSLAQAGVLAALEAAGWPEGAGAGRLAACVPRQPPLVLSHAQPGTEPLRALVEPFLQTWQFDATDPAWEAAQARAGSNLLLDGKATLRGSARCDRAALRRAEPAEAAGLLPLCRPGRGALRARGGAPAPPLLARSWRRGSATRACAR